MTQLNLLEDLGAQVKPASGNRKLVEYGIQNEGSDYRAHVCWPIMQVYVFATQSGKRGVERARAAGMKPTPVRTGDIVTAMGYRVPVSWLEDVREVQIPLDIWKKYHIDEFQTTSQKGRFAAYIVFEMLKRNLIQLSVQPNHADSSALQLNGTDILINSELKLQVKCDQPGGYSYRADHRGRSATGNLFLQESECNQYRRY